MGTKFKKDDLVTTVTDYYRNLIDAVDEKITHEKAYTTEARIMDWRKDAETRLREMHQRILTASNEGSEPVSDIELGAFKIGKFTESQFSAQQRYSESNVETLEREMKHLKGRLSRAVAFTSALVPDPAGNVNLTMVELRSLGIVPKG